MRFAPHLVCLGLAFDLLACGDNTTTTTTIDRPELVAVQPDDFLGQVPCGSNGALSYVATLFDVTRDADGGVPEPGFQLPSSPATSCRVPVTFSLVRPNRRYLAAIDAYARDASRLLPLGSGTRSQTDENLARVAPSWTTTCGAYPPSPYLGGGGYPGVSGTAGSSSDVLAGVRSYPGITQTPHNCGSGLTAVNDQR